MKKVLKLSIGVALAAGLAAPSFAYLNHPIAQQSAVSVTGSYTEISNNGLSFGDYSFMNNVVPPTLVERRAAFIDPHGKFDYALGYTYHLPHSPTHIFMTFDHYRTGKGGTAVGNVINIEVFPDPSPSVNDYVKDEGQADLRSYEFRVGVERFLSFSPYFNMSLNAFAEWDKVIRALFEHARLIENNSTIIHDVVRNTENDMRGWGFGVGAKAHAIPLPKYRHWGAFVDVKTTLLWVRNEFEQNLFTSVTPSGSPGGDPDYLFAPESSDSVVGKLDIRFGIDYTRRFNSNAGRFLLEVDLGMRYLNFVNAIKNGNTYFDSLWTGQQGAFGGNFGANTGFPNDWGRVGPYLLFRLGGADA